jgi:hypothetical protein
MLMAIRLSARDKQRQSYMLLQMTVLRILNGQLLYPYHLQWVQGLKPVDWFVQQCSEPNFLLSVLFSDKTDFDRDGIINFHNHHQWVEDNPHGVLQIRQKQQFSINFGIEIARDWLAAHFAMSVFRLQLPRSTVKWFARSNRCTSAGQRAHVVRA